MGADAALWADLRRLADWFSTSPQRQSIHIDRVVQRLGTVAIPLLGRELRHADIRRREASRAQLSQLADDVLCRTRVVAELRAVTEDAASLDEAKVGALGLLSELGEKAAARFMDPSAIQQRSAVALASQINSDSDVASAADLMVHTLAHADMLSMLEVMADVAPDAARRLVAELSVRLDVAAEARDEIRNVLVGRPVPSSSSADATNTERASAKKRPSRGTQVAVLVDASARLVVVACKKLLGERRYRRWAVLIGSGGTIDDCLHEDTGETDCDAAPLIAQLCADGYRVASSEIEHARNVVTSAARLTASVAPCGSLGNQPALSSAYYLGRDLLDLGDAHIGDRHPTADRARTATLARALEYIGDGAIERGAQLLAAAAPANDDHREATADYWSALAHTQLATGSLAAAVESLERAITVEPEWPLHHYNLACALHQMHDAAGTFHALRKFTTTSTKAKALLGDPDQSSRLSTAERMMAALERASRAAGTPLRRRKRRKQENL
ncbi:MAG TPA: hypothetical protein VGM90_34990 [Kofleriaceae bacterium]|jgi:hypothetical protein